MQLYTAEIVVGAFKANTDTEYETQAVSRTHQLYMRM